MDANRGAFAAARIVAELDGRCSAVSIVLRVEPKGLRDHAVEDALTVPVVARVPTMPSLSSRADDGEPPHLRDAYGRACMTALRAVASGRVA